MGKLWIRILLVVASAFAASVANPGIWPGHWITASISSHVNIYIWVWSDAFNDPKFVWRWLEIALNTVFYGVLFWLVVGFVMRRPQAWRFGLATYTISFFLPALRSDVRYTPGWMCALMALWVWNDDFPGATAGYNLGVKLTIFGGLINLLALAYFLLRIFGQTPRTQRAAAWGILVCMPPMWISLYLIGEMPSIGHVIWIAGLLLMVYEDIREFKTGEVLQRLAFLICGLATFPIARVYSSLQQAAPMEALSLLAYVLPIVGVLALYVALAPNEWLPQADKVRNSGSKFMLAFGLTGLLIVLVVFRFLPPIAFQRVELVYSLCPACVQTTSSLYAVAPLNGLVLGAIGGVVGTVFGVARR